MTSLSGPVYPISLRKSHSYQCLRNPLSMTWEHELSDFVESETLTGIQIKLLSLNIYFELV